MIVEAEEWQKRRRPGNTYHMNDIRWIRWMWGVPRSKTTSTCVIQSTCDLVNAKGSCLAMKHSKIVCTIVYEFEYGPLPPNSKHFVSTSCMYSLIPRPSASSTCIIVYTSYNRNAQLRYTYPYPPLHHVLCQPGILALEWPYACTCKIPSPPPV